MKLIGYIGIVLMAVLAGCGEGLPRPAGTLNPPGPLSEGERTSPDSPAAVRHPLLEGEGLAHKALEEIDSLMWQQADSALKVMLEFAGSPDVNGK